MENNARGGKQSNSAKPKRTNKIVYGFKIKNVSGLINMINYLGGKVTHTVYVKSQPVSARILFDSIRVLSV